MLLVATTPSSTSKADWSALLERPVVSELCSAAMLLPCAATCPSVVARAAAVARGAIAGASALLSSLEASSAVTLSSRDWMAAALLPDAAVFRDLSVRGESQGQLPCGDVRAVSHLSVVQDLRDIAGDRSFKHVFLGVGVIRIHNAGVLYFRSAPSQVLRGVPAVRRSFLYDSGVGVFDTPPHRRHRLLVCQTHQPLFGASFRTCHSPWATLQARPAPGPHQGFFGCDSI